ncbi:RNA polymerase sigma factor [Fimbriiglobus ruber]|uniref:Transcriptional control n=1 Tax=Fimbriiglobus ruber TaxID=1908690 RepID=A0A225DEI2_9BACT|nr:sigma-70 family RNA polymerase sigma factor [Fimbriiglobus ruber]OWK39403.1 transcriptional control [Fimbriiglobus ruber]
MDTTSASLLLGLRSTDDEVHWKRFVHIYTPLLYHWARDMGLQDADAVDLVQDVFTILVQKLPEFSYDSRQSFRGWLRTVAVNKWRETLRRRGVSPNGGAGLDRLPGPDDEWFGEIEFRSHVTRRALRLLHSDFHEVTWQAFWEHVVAGKPAPVVARELGTTTGAVYAAKVRILARLREQLADLMVD